MLKHTKHRKSVGHRRHPVWYRRRSIAFTLAPRSSSFRLVQPPRSVLSRRSRDPVHAIQKLDPEVNFTLEGRPSAGRANFDDAARVIRVRGSPDFRVIKLLLAKTRIIKIHRSPDRRRLDTHHLTIIIVTASVDRNDIDEESVSHELSKIRLCCLFSNRRSISPPIFSTAYRRLYRFLFLGTRFTY